MTTESVTTTTAQRKVRLLNAAVMPREGDYSLQRLTPQQFAQLVRDHSEKGRIDSYIGYPECAHLLTELCEVPIELNRSPTLVVDGDTLLIARLIYRVSNPAAKGQVKATVDDYEFFICRYRAPVAERGWY